MRRLPGAVAFLTLTACSRLAGKAGHRCARRGQVDARPTAGLLQIAEATCGLIKRECAARGTAGEHTCRLGHWIVVQGSRVGSALIRRRFCNRNGV